MASRSGRDSERGAAAVVGIVLLAALVVVTLGATVLGRLLVDHRRAAVAADLAALAGAAAVQRTADGCVAARVIAARNGAALDRCAVHGQEVQVSVRLAAPPLLGRVVGRVVLVRAVARAGPVPGDPWRRRR